MRTEWLPNIIAEKRIDLHYTETDVCSSKLSYVYALTLCVHVETEVYGNNI